MDHKKEAMHLWVEWEQGSRSPVIESLRKMKPLDAALVALFMSSAVWQVVHLPDLVEMMLSAAEGEPCPPTSSPTNSGSSGGAATGPASSPT